MTQRILQLVPLVIETFVSGCNTANIARSFGINKKTVVKILNDNGFETKKSKENLLGRRFGRLLVIKYEKTDENRKIMWLCRCDDGNEKIVRSNDLKMGRVVSCGCYKKELASKNIHKNIRYGSEHGHFSGYGGLPGSNISIIRNGASKRKLEFSVTAKELWELFEKQNGKCALSGIELYFKGSKQNDPRKGKASLDRIDSSKGYIIGNVQWVHKRINNMKGNMVEEEFFKFCQLILQNQYKNE